MSDNSTSAMPAVFIGHGSPMNALEHNGYTDAWTSLARSISRPRAILAISAHWYINATAVTAMSTPKTIHDFFGFPDELFAVRYPAPGDPELAEQLIEVVKPTWVGLDLDSWGLDHGTWSVLVHMYPDADIPVLQLSIDASKPFEYHVALGAQLAKLRQQGVLIVASGNVVHNLGLLDWSRPDAAFDWARDFNDAAMRLMTNDPSQINGLRDNDHFRLAVPTPDHFIPLLYLAGLASAAGRGADVLIDGYTMGSLSMTSYVLAATS
jgi:4,5-DOPA dioxygenase extradiol